MYVLWQILINTQRDVLSFEVAEEDEFDAIELCKAWCYEYILPQPTEYDFFNIQSDRIGNADTKGIKKEPWTCKILEN